MVVFQFDFCKCQVNLVLKQSSQTCWGNWEIISLYSLRSSFSGTLFSLSPTHTQRRRYQKQSVRKTIMSLGLRVAGRVYLAFPLHACSFLDIKTKAFILLIVKSTFPSTSINLWNLKRAPMSWSKRAGFRTLHGGGVSSSLSLLSRTFPNTGQIVRPAQGGWTAVVFYPPSQLLAFHRNQQGSTCETSVVTVSTPMPCVTLHVDEAGWELS